MAEDNQQTNDNQNSDITLEKLQADLDLAINGWKRTAADFENYKKRRAKEGEDLLRFAKEVTVLKLLPSLEALEQALRHAPAEERYKEWNDGVSKIMQGLEKALAELGIGRIKSLGEVFNHELHEAVEMMESPGKKSGEIVEEISGGYTLNGRTIRPAKVKVAK